MEGKIITREKLIDAKKEADEKLADAQIYLKVREIIEKFSQNVTVKEGDTIGKFRPEAEDIKYLCNNLPWIMTNIDTFINGARVCSGSINDPFIAVIVNALLGVIMVANREMDELFLNKKEKTDHFTKLKEMEKEIIRITGEVFGKEQADMLFVK